MAEITRLTRRFWSYVRGLGATGVALTICHGIFFLSVVVRTLATVVSNLSLPVEVSVDYKVSPLFFKLSCLCIWLSGTCMACFLILEIVKNGLLRTVSINFKWFGMVKIGLLLSLILYYEAWMNSYIYKTYVAALDWEFRILLLAPFTTILMHTTLQAFLLSYMNSLNCIRSCSETQYLYFKHYINSSLLFNATMIVHVVCMGIISYAQGSMKKADTPFMLFFGLVEFFYRCYATYKHYHLRSIHHHAHQGIAEHESINPNAIHPDRPYHGMVVTGTTFLFAFFVCACGVSMAINETNINS